MIKREVKQGDTISAMLFPACVEEMSKHLDWEEKGIRIDGEYLSNLRLADDIVLFSSEGDRLQNMFEDLTRDALK